MIHRGVLLPMNRHGMPHDNNVLARAGFEASSAVLAEAAAMGHVDDLRCAASRVIAGLRPLAGTGSSAFELVVVAAPRVTPCPAKVPRASLVDFYVYGDAQT
jgi:hypothetical protein